MKTDEELGEIGNKALLKASHQGELVSRNLDTAFAKAVREAIFADCGEVPSIKKCVDLYYEDGDTHSSMERVRTACTLPLMKRIQESEEKHAHELNRLQLQIAALNMIIEGGQELLTRIRALPEKWRNKAMDLSNDYSASLINMCGAELTAALGESKPWSDSTLTERVMESGGEQNAVPVDKYAELKAAHKAGKVIQGRRNSDRFPHQEIWVDLKLPSWELGVENYRIKPFSLREHVAKSFPSLNDTHVFHRDDFTEDMLPEGWRPLLLGEMDDSRHKDIQRKAYDLGFEDCPEPFGWYAEIDKVSHYRTKRPLPLPPVEVPLEAKDVPPGSLFRCIHPESKMEWIIPQGVSDLGVYLLTNGGQARRFSWEELMTGTNSAQISRDGGKTWEPCKKLKEDAR